MASKAREEGEHCWGLNRGPFNKHSEDGWNKEINHYDEEFADDDELPNEDADESHSKK